MLKWPVENADEEGMDLVASAVQFQQANTMAKVQYAVAGKMLDQQRSDGAAIVNLINSADIGVNKASAGLNAAATGLGGTLDMRA